MSRTAAKPRILAVTSGKGGTGKTNLAVNLALCLRLFKLDVLLLDADLGLGNVDVLLGLDVRRTLRDVLAGECELEDIVVQGPRGLRILPGASGVEELAMLDDGEVDGVLAKVERYCAGMDFVVVDTAPGISPGVVRTLCASDEVLLVVNPEPTALTDAYALLKVFSKRPEARRVPVSVIMNRCQGKEEAIRSFDRLRTAARRFLGLQVQYIGAIGMDDTVGEATRRQVAFLTHYAGSPCSRDVRKIAARIISAARDGGADLGRFFKTIGEAANE